MSSTISTSPDYMDYLIYSSLVAIVIAAIVITILFCYRRFWTLGTESEDNRDRPMSERQKIREKKRIEDYFEREENVEPFEHQDRGTPKSLKSLGFNVKKDSNDSKASTIISTLSGDKSSNLSHSSIDSTKK